jgi:uncharacterized protein (TIGR02145 family)
MIGKNLLNYEIKSELGRGGMAVVYKAENTMLGTKVALKVLKEEFVYNKNIRTRFLDEARKMASVKHPNIVQVFDLLDIGSLVAIVMEYVEGKSLKDLIEREGKLDDKTAESLLNQMLSALQCIHQSGFVHRDIKPSNFMLGKDGAIKLADFGIAKDKNAIETTETGTQMGTPMYMSPEQVKADKSIDHRSDIYSLGVTLYCVLSGKPPYDANITSQFDIFNKIVHEPLTEIESTSYLTNIIRKACQKDREQRFQSCEEWLHALKSVQVLKIGTATFDTTILEPASSDNTIFEAPKAEKTKIKQTYPKPNREQDIQREIKETLEILYDKSNNITPPLPSKNTDMWIFSIVGWVAFGLFIVGILFMGGVLFMGGGKRDSTANNESLITGTVADIDGQTYETVDIGNQTWMAENLNVSTFRNGDPIPEAKTEEEWRLANKQGKPTWCYYDNNRENGTKYGKLYNWFAVNDSRGLAPKGWHIPNDVEWTTLIRFLGGETDAGVKMKSTSGWNDLEDSRLIDKKTQSVNVTNSSGFSGIPGGDRSYIGTFDDMGIDASWWSSTEDGKDRASFRGLNYSTGYVNGSLGLKEFGFSVRCIKD